MAVSACGWTLPTNRWDDVATLREDFMNLPNTDAACAACPGVFVSADAGDVVTDSMSGTEGA